MVESHETSEEASEVMKRREKESPKKKKDTNWIIHLSSIPFSLSDITRARALFFSGHEELL